MELSVGPGGKFEREAEQNSGPVPGHMIVLASARGWGGQVFVMWPCTCSQRWLQCQLGVLSLGSGDCHPSSESYFKETKCGGWVSRTC